MIFETIKTIVTVTKVAKETKEIFDQVFDATSRTGGLSNFINSNNQFKILTEFQIEELNLLFHLILDASKTETRPALKIYYKNKKIVALLEAENINKNTIAIVNNLGNYSESFLKKAFETARYRYNYETTGNFEQNKKFATCRQQLIKMNNK